jgi:hypothetical protein
MAGLQKFAAVVAAFQVGRVLGDGTGMIGWGKTLYDPACAFACRSVIKSCQLLCTPEDDSVNHGTAHNPVATPPECFTSDPAFLQTIALCIDTYCPLSDRPEESKIGDYWASHLGTGTVGDYTWVPTISYEDALATAREDERRAANSTHEHHGELRLRHGGGGYEQPEMDYFHVSSPLPIVAAGDPLNVTSFIEPKEWQTVWNGMVNFEENEKSHVTYTLVPHINLEGRHINL